MTIGELYEKLGQLDGEQMQGEVKFINDDKNAVDIIWGNFVKIKSTEFDGENVWLR